MGPSYGNQTPPAGLRTYYCHTCGRPVMEVAPQPSEEVFCSLCHGGFLEEWDAPDPFPVFEEETPDPENLHAPHAFYQPSFIQPHSFYLHPERIDLQDPQFFPFPPFQHSPMIHNHGVMFIQAPNGHPFNPVNFLQNYLTDLRAGGADIHFVLEDHPAVGWTGDPGDYYVGPDFEQLIQQLADNDPNRYGTPPASTSVVQSLPTMRITRELLASDSSQCAVCKDEFEEHMEAMQLPCNHIYHPDCIIPWLELHNSCPVCRHELPTDDPDYENRWRGYAGQTSNAGPSTVNTRQERSRTPTIFRRRVNISLPWYLSPFVAHSGATMDRSFRGYQQHPIHRSTYRHRRRPNAADHGHHANTNVGCPSLHSGRGQPSSTNFTSPSGHDGRARRNTDGSNSGNSHDADSRSKGKKNFK